MRKRGGGNGDFGHNPGHVSRQNATEGRFRGNAAATILPIKQAAEPKWPTEALEEQAEERAEERAEEQVDSEKNSILVP